MKREETRTTTVMVEDTCDWCGAKIAGGGIGEVNEFTCKWHTGAFYPTGGGSGAEVEFDLCRVCRPKFFALMEAQGIKYRDSDWET